MTDVDPDIGGKGRGLYALEAVAKVPQWIAVPSRVFAAALKSSDRSSGIEELVDSLSEDNAAEVSKKIQQMILSMKMADELKEELQEIYREKFSSSFVSVRSSAVDEDGRQHSFAGIHESYLYVQGIESVIEHIQKVWASGYEERALIYRLQNKLTLHPVPMAVIVQRMVDANRSGVVFTVDPISQNPQKMLVSALYGLGEGLVSAGLDADSFQYDKRDGSCVETIAHKESQYVQAEKNSVGLVKIDVAVELRKKAALSREQVDALCEVAGKIERQQGRPQDIEFCFDNENQLFVLQTRDITTVQEYGPAAGNPQIWDNSNIIESYSGVTSPMTFSFIRHAYAVVYHCFSEVMGIPQKTIDNNQQVYSNMLGLFQGQVFYNLPNWYRLVQQFPGYAYNKSFMESMMGVKDTADASDEEEGDAGFFKRYVVELPRLLMLVCRMLHKFMSLKRLVPAFDRHFNHWYEKWTAMNFDALPPHELMQVYQDMERHLLRNWKTPIINDFYVMVFYGALKGCCKKWCGDENGTLQNNLICGEGDIASTEPARMLMQLAVDIKKQPGLRELFLSSSPEELLNAVNEREDTADIRERVQTYLDAFGFRCMNELKLEEPSLHETPEFIYQMVSNYVRMDDSLLDLDTAGEREKIIRADAEQAALSKLSPLKRYMFRFVLKHARLGVKNRENMRFARTKIYGLLRQLLNSIGSYFVRENIMDDAQDIYFLTIDEVWDYIKGTAVSTNLRGLASLRTEEFEGYRSAAEEPDDHFETYGLAYHKNRFKNHETTLDKGSNEPGVLRGVGCSPGVIEGEVRIIHSPKDDTRLNGEILVAARTDPGWVPLYPSISGLLIERGSILSHSAIVAREMGIPAIVGIPCLLETLSDGQKVTMDATKGTVKTNPHDGEQS